MRGALSWCNGQHERECGCACGGKRVVRDSINMMCHKAHDNCLLLCVCVVQTTCRPVADSAEYIASIKEVASYSCSLLRYSEDGATCTFSSTSNISDDDNSSMVGGGSGGGPETVEVWYDSRCYFRVPASLAGVDATGQQDVVLEVGALLPTNQAPEQLGSSDEDSVSVKQQPGAAGGLLRWRVCYDGGAGHRRLKWAANELWVV